MISTLPVSTRNPFFAGDFWGLGRILASSRFFPQAVDRGDALFLSVIAVGELRCGVELIRHRGDVQQALTLELWLTGVLDRHRQHILDFDVDAAQVWGVLRVPHAEHEIDKQIAAIALVNDLTVVTRNRSDFVGTGVRLLNPFSPT